MEITLSISSTNEPILPPDTEENKVLEWKDTSGSICASTYRKDGYHWMHWPGLATFKFMLSSEKVTVIPDRHSDPRIIQEVFWRSVLPFVLQAQGKEALHASSCVVPGGIVLFCGISGSGKSTLAYGFTRRGYKLWSDDSVIFEITDGKISAIPTPTELRLLPDTLLYFQSLETDGAPGDNKIFTNNSFTFQKAIRAIFILQRNVGFNNSTPIEVVTLSPAIAFQKLLENAYCFSLSEKEEKIRLTRNYLGLVAKTPVFQVHFFPGFDKFSLLMDAIERQFLAEEYPNV